MQFSKEDVAYINMYSDLLIEKHCVPEDGFRDSCSEIFVIFAEKYTWPSLLLRTLQYVESQFF